MMTHRHAVICTGSQGRGQGGSGSLELWGELTRQGELAAERLDGAREPNDELNNLHLLFLMPYLLILSVHRG